MFKKILIANRGEIAVRVMNTCKELNIPTVAVYSDADSKALHTLTADESFHIGESEPSYSYLNIDKIINAAKKSNADAIHPGYGFLAENADFARECENQGITFIGPPPDVISNLGDKTKARRIMQKGNVPVIPGTTNAAQDAESIINEADAIGWPVLIKAAAGGGGKGMRIVNSREEMEEAFSAASREAESAFGDDSIYLEKFISRARHVEFQILADKFGNALHLFERECSIQRRHQKIIEETPSVSLTPDLRKKMGNAAVMAAQASGYVNAGTVEFLLEPDGNFYFLEVNTRLQVEHPITEMITGIDLVKKQIEIAAGEPLTLTQHNITAKGHAIECRVYGEDPENSFFPSSGTIQFAKEPSGPGIRCDSGIYSGFTVPVDYDPILTKVAVHSETRKDATNRMIKALSEFTILGITTNVHFLMDILKSDNFHSGETYTDFIESNFADWSSECSDSDKDETIACIVFITDSLLPKHNLSISSENKLPEPWQTLGNWRMS
jgi:acetyl-CoA carboxylase, biotin carboxylase subunit